MTRYEPLPVYSINSWEEFKRDCKSIADWNDPFDLFDDIYDQILCALRDWLNKEENL